MGECDYWRQEDTIQWCDITDGRCRCDGLELSCSLNGKSISAALHEEDRESSVEAALRARRKKAAKRETQITHH